MNAAMVDGIVKAVLYEGYMLYPYRPSAVKNRQRFNFGVVYPRAYSHAQGGTDAWSMQTECLVQGNGLTHCTVRVRFLRMVDRSVGKPAAPTSELSALAKEGIEKVERLEVNGTIYQAWQEAVEEVIEVTEFNLFALAIRTMQWPIRLSARHESEPIRDANGLIVGILQREKASISGTINLAAEQLMPGLFKLTAQIENETSLAKCDFVPPRRCFGALARFRPYDPGIARRRICFAGRSPAGTPELCQVVQERWNVAGPCRDRGQARHDALVADHSVRLSADFPGKPG